MKIKVFFSLFLLLLLCKLSSFCYPSKGGDLSKDINVFALAAEPLFHSSKFEVSSSSSGQVILNFDKLLIINAAGSYLILRAEGTSAPDISLVTDGQAPSAISGYLTTIESTGVESYTDTNVIPGTTYTYLLIPYTKNAGDETSYNYLTTDDSTVPTARPVPEVTGTTTAVPVPTNLTAALSGASNKDIDFDWDDMTPDADSYSWELSTDAGFDVASTTSGSATTSNVSFNNLEYNRTYYFRVLTVNTINGSDYESTYAETSILTAPDSPDPSGTNILSTSFRIMWASVGGATAYEVRVSTKNGSGANSFGSNLFIDNVQTSDTFFDVSEISAGVPLDSKTTYYFRVRALNNGLTGAYSSIKSAQTADAIPPIQVSLVCLDADKAVCQGESISFVATPLSADYTYEFSVDYTDVAITDPAATTQTGNNEFSFTPSQSSDFIVSVLVTDDVSGTSFTQAASGISITTNDVPVISLDTSKPRLFQLDGSADPVDLNPYVAGSTAGAFSGNGVYSTNNGSNYYFSPSLAGNGEHAINYTASVGECTDSENMNFIVFSGLIANLVPLYCSYVAESQELEIDTSDGNLGLDPTQNQSYVRTELAINGAIVTNTSYFELVSTSGELEYYKLYPQNIYQDYGGNTDILLELRIIVDDPTSNCPQNDPCDSCWPSRPGYCSDPCDSRNPSYPGSCTDGCDTRHPNYPNSCPPCERALPDRPSYCSDPCDTRNPNYNLAECCSVNPSHPDCGVSDPCSQPFPPSYCSDPCLKSSPSYNKLICQCPSLSEPCLQPLKASMRDFDEQLAVARVQLNRSEPSKYNVVEEYTFPIAEGVSVDLNSSKDATLNKVISDPLTAVTPAPSATNEVVWRIETSKVTVPAVITDIGLDSLYCSTDLPIKLSLPFNPDSVIAVNQSAAISVNGSGSYFFSPRKVEIPTGNDSVNVILKYYFKDGNTCINSFADTVTVYGQPVEPPLAETLINYCQGDNIAKLGVDRNTLLPGATVRWYSDQGTGFLVEGDSLFTGIGGDNPILEDFYVTQTSVYGCEGIPSRVFIRVNALPQDMEILPPPSESYCKNYDGLIRLEGKNAPIQDSTAGTFVIRNNDDYYSYSAVADTTATDTLALAYFNPADLKLGRYQVSYEYTDGNGCTNNSDAQPLQIKDYVPEVDFNFARICEGKETVFDYNVSLNSGELLDSVFWDFGGEAYIEHDSIYRVFRHQFSQKGIYDVSFTAQTKSYCLGTITKKVGIFPMINVANDNHYVQSFENGHDWFISEELGLGNLSSWALSTPTGDTISGAASGVNAWITNAGIDGNGNPTNTYNKSENSWVESPCFDLSELERPVLTFKIWSDTEEGFDGAVLEYSVEDTTSWETDWKVVGSIDEGLNWYNSPGISGSPGNQQGVSIGWSGKLHSTWETVKYPLDAIRVEADGRPVRFRVAFGSNSDNAIGKTFDGFAFDDFTIESRNRVVLLEHFTNLSSAESRDEDGKLRTFVEGKSPEVIDIQYHTSFPGADPLNQFNKADPSARALHYAIAEVPRTVMDGIYGVYYKNEPFFRESWGVNAYNTRALISAPFNIDITLGDDVSTALEITAEISKNNTAEAIEGNLIVQVAVVERQVTIDGNTYYNVVRRLLPNAAGNRLFGDWQPEDSRVEQVVQSWNPAVEPGDSEFMIVASIYNEKSKEIYQAAYMSIPASKMPPMAKVTGVDDLLSKEGIHLFPNPAEKEINILFPAPLSDEYTLTVYDLHGVEVYRGTIGRGADKTTLNTEAYSSGVYSIRLNSSTDQVIRRFVKK